MNPITPLFDRKRTLIAVLLATLTMAIALPAVTAQAITVETNKDVYVPGDVLIVSGTAPPSAAVSIQVYNPAGSQCGIGQNTSDAQGNYMVTVFTFPSEPSGGNTAEKTIQFASQAPPPPPPTAGPVAVSIDVGAFYFPGETATFYILTTISGVPASVAGLTSNLYLPDGTKVPVNPVSIDAGLYKAEYALPEDASEGSYALMVYVVQGEYKASAIKSFQVSATLSSLNAKLVALEGTVATLQTDVGTVKTDVDAINLRVSDISQGVALIQTDLGTVKGKVEKIEGNIATISTDLGTVKADISSLGSSVDATKSSVDDMKKAVEGIPDTMSAVTMPIWAAVILSLIAAIAAIASVIQISRKIAG